MLIRFTLSLALTRLAGAVCWHDPAAVALPSFGYALERGPLTWAGLAPAPQYDACRLGKKQSPIVVYTRSAKRVEPKNFKMNITQYINSGGVELENLGTTLEVHAGREHGSLVGVIAIEGEPYGPYRLENMHFHTPSEHRINDEYYPLEMHLVFKSGNRFAVIGVLFQLVSGSPPNNEFMHNLFLSVRNITRPGTSTITGTLDFRGLSNAIKTGPLYTYNGSLTTPPCTENVKWLVLGGTRPLHVDTYNKVKSVMKFNARYSQNAPEKINLLEKARRIADGATVAASSELEPQSDVVLKGDGILVGGEGEEPMVPLLLDDEEYLATQNVLEW